MKSNHNNEAITHLAMPERQIPVLIDSSPEKAEGFVPSIVWSDKPVTSVRRLLPSFIDGLDNPRKRKEIEKEHGIIDRAEWDRLREMLALKDRLNAGDWSPVVTFDTKELDPLPALLDRLSPGGWFIEEDKGNSEKRTLRSASGDMRASVSFDIELEKHPLTSPVGGALVGKDVPHIHPGVERSGNDEKPILEFKGKIGFEVMTVAFALSKAFTIGLSKTRFVVWWHEATKKFVPGLYCPDVVTALYALAMWSSGTAGGWAICQRCGENYPRKRAKQFYCGSKCRVAAAMKRLRDKQKLEAKPELKAPAESNKRKGGK